MAQTFFSLGGRGSCYFGLRFRIRVSVSIGGRGKVNVLGSFRVRGKGRFWLEPST